MNILILGTSNSILSGGWTFGLRDALPSATIRNLSIGASPGMQFAAEIGEHVRNHDFVFLDSVVNDEHLARNIGDIHYNNRLIYEIAAILSARCRTILMGFTKSKYLAEPSEQFLLRREMAAATGAQFIDVRDLVLRFGQAILRDDRRLYEHIGHPHREIAYALGYELGSSLAGYPAHRPPATDYLGNFVTCLPSEMSGRHGGIVRRRNRLLEADFLMLRPGEFVTFAAEETCIGFYVCKSETRAIIRLSGKGGIRHKELMYQPSPRLEVIFVPITDGFRLNRIDFHSQQLPFERSIHSDFHGWLENGYAQLALGRVVFWRGNREEAPPRPADTETCLTLNRILQDRLSRRFPGTAQPATVTEGLADLPG